jgi:hypothetical protein
MENVFLAIQVLQEILQTYKLINIQNQSNMMKWSKNKLENLNALMLKLINGVKGVKQNIFSAISKT